MTKTRRALLTVVAALLLVVMSVGGTLAWLQATSGTVINTFETSDITIKLDESPLNADGTLNTSATKVTTNSYQLVPGVNLNKDPQVTVTNDVDCYVFLVVNESQWVADNLANIVYYNIDGDVWTALDTTNYPGVYYKEVAKSENDTVLNVLDEQKVYVTNALSKDNMPDAAVKLSFTAYAIQKTGWTGTLTDAYKQAAGITD